MRRHLIVMSLFASLTIVLVMGHQESANAKKQATSPARLAAIDSNTAEMCVADMYTAEPLGTPKKCSFNSDCKYGKCKSGRCGACSFNSDCNGYGKCKNGQCGACSFSSDCKGFGSCSGGKCSKSPW